MFLTGHRILKKHLKKMGLLSDSNCRFYKEKLEETAEHLLGYCIIFEYERIILFEKWTITLKENWHVNHLIDVKLLREYKINRNFHEYRSRI